MWGARGRAWLTHRSKRQRDREAEEGAVVDKELDDVARALAGDQRLVHVGDDDGARRGGLLHGDGAWRRPCDAGQAVRREHEAVRERRGEAERDRSDRPLHFSYNLDYPFKKVKGR